MTSSLLAVAEEAAHGGGLLTDLGINLPVLLTQVVVFSITFLALGRILFSTVLRRLQEREDELRKAHEAVGRDRAEAARLAADYEARLARSDQAAYERAQALLRDGLAQAQSVVARASAEAKLETDRAAAEIAAWRRSARPQLLADARRLALDLAGKALGGPLDAAAGAAADRWLAGRS
jgi:F-type H+-transporting ATPase subunit b